MAYEKQTWEDYPSTNTPITSDRLNHIEQGIYDNSTTLQTITTTVQNIIQSGSNANGSYIKYSDGTMICYGNYSFNSSNSDYWGNFYRSENYTINFPQGFSTTPIVNVTPNSDDGSISAVLNIVNLNTFEMCQIKSKGINPNTNLSNLGQYVAIGRWK